ELERAVLELSSVTRTAARQATALDQAIKSNGKASAQLARHELEKLSRHEKMIAARIDDECRPK
ncbi:MAG TPA: hypothetical protein VGQ57_21115, partial [Polyangiaceae bacterium]|nr:hypothetical protein [Polyangiaceae bacterium]